MIANCALSCCITNTYTFAGSKGDICSQNFREVGCFKDSFRMKKRVLLSFAEI